MTKERVYADHGPSDLIRQSAEEEHLKADAFQQSWHDQYYDEDDWEEWLRVIHE